MKITGQTSFRLVWCKIRILQGAVIRKVSYPILGQPPDLSRPPTPRIFPSRKPLLASHTPRPPLTGKKVGGKIMSRHFVAHIKHEGRPLFPYIAQPSTPNHHGRLAPYTGLLFRNNINISVLWSIKTSASRITYIASMFPHHGIVVGCYYTLIYAHTWWDLNHQNYWYSWLGAYNVYNMT